jgi:hypothetical protein
MVLHRISTRSTGIFRLVYDFLEVSPFGIQEDSKNETDRRTGGSSGRRHHDGTDYRHQESAVHHGQLDELKRQDECSKYDLEALWRELPMYHTLLWQVIEGLDNASDELLTTAKTMDELDIPKGY